MHTDDIGIEQHPSFNLGPPWHQSENHIDDNWPTWPTLGTAQKRNGELQERAKSYGLNRIETAKRIPGDGLLMFTDGSAFPDARGGGGSSVIIHAPPPRNFIPLSEPAGLISSSFSTELWAIQLALKKALDLSQAGRPIAHVTVLSDCQGAVKLALTSKGLGPESSYWSVHKKIQVLKRLIREGGTRRLNIDWIPAHCGINLNERADTEAKNAAHLSRSQTQVALSHTKPLMLARSFINKRLRQVRQGCWYNSQHGRELFQYHKEAANGVPREVRQLSRRHQIILCRLRTGNATTNVILHKLGKKTTPHCDHCPGEEDSPSHRIIHCPKYSEPRKALTEKLLRLEQPLALSLHALLCFEATTPQQRKAVLQAFCHFLDETELNNLFVWKPPQTDTV